MKDLNKLVFASFSKDDNFTTLDFTEVDGSDPLGVNDFIRNRATLYLSNNLCAVYTVRYAGQIVAYFTASMSAIETKRLVDEDKVPNVGILSYPALLMGQMAVDKNHRGQGIGYWICEFCVGLAQEMNNKVGCALVILQTNKDKLSTTRRNAVSNIQKSRARKERYGCTRGSFDESIQNITCALSQYAIILLNKA